MLLPLVTQLLSVPQKILQKLKWKSNIKVLIRK